MYLLTTNSPPQGNGRNVLHLDCHAEAFRHKKRTPQFCGVLLYKLLKSLISASAFMGRLMSQSSPLTVAASISCARRVLMLSAICRGVTPSSYCRVLLSGNVIVIILYYFRHLLIRRNSPYRAKTTANLRKYFKITNKNTKTPDVNKC